MGFISRKLFNLHYNCLMQNRIYLGDNLEVLKQLESESIPLIYIDPPFNSKKTQSRTRIKTVQDENGDRQGFQGKSYKTIKIATRGYADTFAHDEYLSDFLRPRLEEAYRILAPNGSLYFHIDYREVHYCKILLDEIFGRENFLNEIIWAYDYGGRSKKRWPAKHDSILYYAKDAKNYTFNYEDVDRIPYMAPGLVSKEKRERGKFPTDVWWQTIVPTNGKERTGYPTQKPIQILKRIITASSKRGETVLDFFAGSGTTGAACLELERNFILVDNNPESIKVMQDRFNKESIEWL